MGGGAMEVVMLRGKVLFRGWARFERELFGFVPLGVRQFHIAAAHIADGCALHVG